MKQARQFWSLLRSATTPALAFVIVAFFGGYALFGSNGIVAGFEYRQQLEKRQEALALKAKERAELANRVALLDPRHADPDLVDELARRDLGVTHPDEVIVPLK